MWPRIVAQLLKPFWNVEFRLNIYIYGESNYLFGWLRNELQETEGHEYGSKVSHRKDWSPAGPNCKNGISFLGSNLIIKVCTILRLLWRCSKGAIKCICMEKLTSCLADWSWKCKKQKGSWIWQHCNPIMKSNCLLSQTIMGRKVP